MNTHDALPSMTLIKPTFDFVGPEMYAETPDFYVQLDEISDRCELKLTGKNGKFIAISQRRKRFVHLKQSFQTVGVHLADFLDLFSCPVRRERMQNMHAVNVNLSEEDGLFRECDIFILYSTADDQVHIHFVAAFSNKTLNRHCSKDGDDELVVGEFFTQAYHFLLSLFLAAKPENSSRELFVQSMITFLLPFLAMQQFPVGEIAEDFYNRITTPVASSAHP